MKVAIVIASIFLFAIFFSAGVGLLEKGDVRAIWEQWTSDCSDADRLVNMAHQALGDARDSWVEDPCGDALGLDCRVFLLEASVSEGCLSMTDADCFLGEEYFRQSRFEHAVKQLRSCVSRNDSANSLWYLARSYFELGLEAKANETRARLIEVRNRYPNRVDDDLPAEPF
jgi:hypothetical protein